MALAPGARLGPYEVADQIGVGGMGEVYRATDTNLKRAVAIKVLPADVAADAERLARFQREAEVLASLNHPNIAAIYGLERTDGETALILELVEGPTLGERIAQGPIPLGEAVPIARQIADALEAAHEAGVIHRDLKPANVKLRPDGTVKVLDFGLAKAIDPARGISVDVSQTPTITTPAQTMQGMILGTAAYMSPEQARGKPADKRADIWAFGVVLYEMLTGERAFASEDVSLTLADVMRAEPAWDKLPAGLPPSLVTFLKRCLRKDAKERVRDIGDVRLALEGAFDTPEAQALPGTPAPALQKPLLLAGWVTAAVLAAIALGAVLLRPADPPRDTVRFSVPTGAAANPYSLALSPDGRYLAFVAGPSAEEETLFLRPLDAADAQPVPGTEGAAFPFWSADGQHIGFAAQGTLKRVPLAGGPPRNLADLLQGQNFAGGTWNADGVILFSAGGTLFRVPAAGGEPVALTHLATESTANVLPSFLPDGQRFLYASFQGSNGLFVGALDPATESVQLTEEPAVAVYVPSSGYLVFNRQDAVLAQPFDADGLSFTGEAIRLADGVFFTEGVGAFSVSASGALAYRSGPGLAGALNSQLVWYDRDGQRVETIGEPDEYGGFALSPDERWIAVHRHEEPNGGGIWLFDRQRGNFSRLTLDDSHNFAPIWSPDGRQVLFSSNRGDGLLRLYRQAANNAGQVELVFESDVNSVATDWSAHGPTMFVVQGRGADNIAIWTVPADGSGEPASISNSGFPEAQAVLSPDGRWLAYQSNESGRQQVFVRPYPEPTAKYQISTAGGTNAHWSGDGRQLFYLSPNTAAVMVVDIDPDDATDALSAGAPRVLVETDIAIRHLPGGWPYDVSADGGVLINERPSSGRAEIDPSIAVVLNWDAELEP